MKTSIRRFGLVTLTAAALAGALLFSPMGAHAVNPPAYSLVPVGVFGGEPSITSDNNGVLYETTPSGSAPVYRSTDRGVTWTSLGTAWSGSGDDCITTDESNAAYWCNLGGQADVWKSITAATCITSAQCDWKHGAGSIGQIGGSSSQPFQVDRQWTAASLTTHTLTAQALVVLMYHDFFGPSQIWVNISTDGGANFGNPTPVLAGPAITPGAITGTLLAGGYMFCNTVPIGVGIVKQKLPNGTANPHAGRIFVSWIAADPAQNATACNYSMAQSFHTLWVSYSDDGGTSWTPQMAFDAGLGHDSSTPFSSFALDDNGNPYIGFNANHWDPNPAINLALPQECAGFSQQPGQVLQTHPECGYDMYVVWSRDGGATWNGGGGTIPGSAAAPYKVNSDTGTGQFGTLAAGDPGMVDVSFLHTPTIEPVDNLGKFLPGGCNGPDPIVPASMNFPPACHWNLEVGQSLNLTSPPTGAGAATWTTSMATTADVHVGDICNLGIACLGPDSNRDLLDFNMEAVDPTTGCAHVAYADEVANQLRVANQIDGPAVIGNGTCASVVATPEVPFTTLLPLAGVAAVVAFAETVRRRRAVHRQINAPM